jgi:drug/metabolite transporter (DMT)-like permease
MLFALMAALGTTGYSIVDDSALRMLRSSAALADQRIPTTLIYSFFETLSSAMWLMLLMACGARCKEGKGSRFRDGFGSAALAGVGISFAYVLVLLAMTFAKNVSYVVAFRQLSIPIGATFGMTILKEPRHPMKLVGIGIMLVGLVLVAVM